MVFSLTQISGYFQIDLAKYISIMYFIL